MVQFVGIILARLIQKTDDTIPHAFVHLTMLIKIDRTYYLHIHIQGLFPNKKNRNVVGKGVPDKYFVFWGENISFRRVQCC